jgi:hypothetical protein
VARWIGRGIALAFLLSAAWAGWALYTGQLRVPDRWNPWAPLKVKDSLNHLTAFKLHRASANPALCMAALETSALRFQPVPGRDTGKGCGLHNAVRISGAGPSVPGAAGVTAEPFLLSCPAALSLAMWERHALQPAAQSRFGEGVVRLEHFGSYACRNVYNEKEGRLSQHATADALDLAGVRLASGRRISVLGDWPRDAAPEGLFLREVHAGACRFFNGVLGPDYNAAHGNHFHMDRGPYSICR